MHRPCKFERYQIYKEHGPLHPDACGTWEIPYIKMELGEPLTTEEQKILASMQYQPNRGENEQG